MLQILPKMLFLDSHVSYLLFSQSYPRFPGIPKVEIFSMSLVAIITDCSWLRSLYSMTRCISLNECLSAFERIQILSQ